MQIKDIIKAKEKSIELATASTKTKNKTLRLIANALKKNKETIIKENKKDIDNAKITGLSSSLLKRLEINSEKISEMVNGIRDLIKLDDPIGKTLLQTELDKGLILTKVSCPIGVIGAIFESRPDALVQISGLCIKSGNAVILKGGSEAKNSNKVLFELISSAVKSAGLPHECVQLIETREDVRELLKLDSYLDLIIPRGSNKFVKFIMENTKIPVLGHSEGICHIYVDKDADINKAVKICIDAKCQYPAVCNAMETLLIDNEIANNFLPKIIRKIIEANVELRLDERSIRILSNINKDILKNNKIKKATEEDWGTEYNELVLSIKIVDSIDNAIIHINKYGSKHTDGIITENRLNAEKFMNLVDSSSVMWNCSTRFSDGYRYGFGAEVGISTSKIHARGPVGLDGLTIYKYKLTGNGQVVSDYVGKNAKKFLHRKIK